MDFVETAAFCDAVGVGLASFAKRFARRMEKGRKRDDGNGAEEGLSVLDEFTSGQSTAKKAAAILVAKNAGFRVPTARQKQNLAIAFAKRGMVVYGKAFDIARVSGQVNLDDLNEVEQHLGQVTIFQ